MVPSRKGLSTNDSGWSGGEVSSDNRRWRAFSETLTPDDFGARGCSEHARSSLTNLTSRPSLDRRKHDEKINCTLRTR